MKAQLGERLNEFSDKFVLLLVILQNNAIIISLLAGLTLPFIFNMPAEERKNAPFWLKAVACISILFFIFGTISPLTIKGLSYIFSALDDQILFRISLWAITISFTFAGFCFHLIARRLFIGEIDTLRHRLIKKSKLERNTRTDVREVKKMLPDSISYNPLDYVDINQGVFIGLDKDNQPQYIPVAEFQSQHADIIGTTGSGKGVGASVLLYQAILLNEAVFVEDPKNDEWAPHVLKYACEKAGKRFVLIDLNKLDHQLDLLAGISGEQLEELFNAGFSLAKKGEGADFYRIADRRAARNTSAIYKPGMTIRDLFESDFVTSLKEEAAGFYGEIEEISLLNCINASGGFSLKEIFDEGGCCYIIGSMRNQKIISAQRMILIRLIQLAESRDRISGKPRPVSIFLDELKYHLSRPAMEGLGAARDKGVHIIMAHQSIKDLYDCPADLEGEAVAGSVIENCKFMLVYRLRDPDTAEWVAKMTGSILVDDEMRRIKTDLALTEKMDTDRMVRQAERYYIDSNMLLNLPPFVGYVFTQSDLPKATKLSHIRVKKQYIENLSFNQMVFAETVPEETEKPSIDL